MEKTKKNRRTPREFFAGIGRWAKRHKKAVILLAVALVLAVAGLIVFNRFGARLFGQSQKTGSTVSFIRTTTLTKGTLSDTVNATGTVASADVYNVTTSLNYAVKTVNVQVGDIVKTGDVICVLDSSSLEDQIAKQEEALADGKETAQNNYDKAVTTYNDAVSASEAQEVTLNSANTALTAATSAYQTVKTTVAALQSAYDTALAAQTAAGDAYAAALNACPAAVHDGTDAACTCVDEKQAYDAAQNTFRQAQEKLASGKTACNYDSLEKTYQQAADAVSQARSRLDELEKTVTSSKEQMTNAAKSLEKASTSDELDTLYDQLEKCTLTATGDGTVTAVSATVGSVCQGNIATIQNTDSLVVSFTVQDYDITSVKLGQSVQITSDATDGTITGVVSMLSPTAGQDGSFSAECTIDGGANGLYIGMSANVAVILSSVDDVYIVPYDAVGEDEQGNSVIYKKTGGSGTDATFEPVIVTTGAETDYYIEVSGDELSEGMEIRASANAEDALTTVPEEATSDSESGAFSFGFGGMPSGEMPSGGGNMPSGGMPSGGNMPSDGGQRGQG